RSRQRPSAFKSLATVARLQNPRRRRPRIAVADLAADFLEPRKKHCGQRRFAISAAEFAIRRSDCVPWVGVSPRTGMDQRKQVRHPDTRAQTFSPDIADDNAQGRTAQPEHLEKIAGQVAHRKNLSRNLETRRIELAR